MLTMFTTTDLYRAAFLMARGHTVSVHKFLGGTGPRCQFTFPPTAADDAMTFDSGQAISAAVFADGIKRLKTLIARAPLTALPEAAR